MTRAYGTAPALGDGVAETARAMAEAAGLTYWPGGDHAPADWDGGPYLCRDGKLYHLRGYGWKHGEFCSNPTSDWDRIGYRAVSK